MSQSVSSISIWVINTSQGNCVVLRHKDNAVILDAGMLKLSGTEILNDLFKIALSNARVRAVVVTHPEEDCYTLLTQPALLPHLQKENPVIILGRNASTYQSIISSEKNDIPADAISLRRQLNEALGFADSTDDEGFFVLHSADSNTNNIVLSLSHPCRVLGEEKLNTILFAGDTTTATLQGISSNPDNKAILERTTFALLHSQSTIAREWFNFLSSELCQNLKRYLVLLGEDVPFGHCECIVDEDGLYYIFHREFIPNNPPGFHVYEKRQDKGPTPFVRIQSDERFDCIYDVWYDCQLFGKGGPPFICSRRDKDMKQRIDLLKGKLAASIQKIEETKKMIETEKEERGRREGEEKRRREEAKKKSNATKVSIIGIILVLFFLIGRFLLSSWNKRKLTSNQASATQTPPIAHIEKEEEERRRRGRKEKKKEE